MTSQTQSGSTAVLWVSWAFAAVSILQSSLLHHFCVRRNSPYLEATADGCGCCSWYPLATLCWVSLHSCQLLDHLNQAGS